jgi:hypothetical protein
MLTNLLTQGGTACHSIEKGKGDGKNKNTNAGAIAPNEERLGYTLKPCTHTHTLTAACISYRLIAYCCSFGLEKNDPNDESDSDSDSDSDGELVDLGVEVASIKPGQKFGEMALLGKGTVISYEIYLCIKSINLRTEICHHERFREVRFHHMFGHRKLSFSCSGGLLQTIVDGEG